MSAIYLRPQRSQDPRAYLTKGHGLLILLRPLRPELDGQDVEASSREDRPYELTGRFTLTCQTSTGQIVWQVVRRDGDQVDGKWMVDA
jgi:hypothetical protein